MKMFLSMLVVALGVVSEPAFAQKKKPAAQFRLFVATQVQPASTPGQPVRPAKPRSGTWRDLRVGEPHELIVQIGRSPSGCGFIWGGKGFGESAHFGWRIALIPTTVSRDYADVTLRWVRAVEDGKPNAGALRETDVRLRPGEGFPLDATALSGVSAPGCRNAVVSLYIQLDEVEPRRERVVATDLWLVHRDPDGREVTQQLNVRGKFNDTVPFYFDDIRVGRDVLDVYGTLRAKTSSDNTVALEFRALRRWSRGTEYPELWALGDGGTTFTLKPDDVTSVVIPLVTEGLPLDGAATQPGRDPALSGHSLSIRLRSRQIR
jgi:hypothetical protein